MPDTQQHPSQQPYLLWICPGRLELALDASTWLQTTKELKNLGWNMLLISAGQTGFHQIDGVEVYSISSPNKYLLRQIVFHIKLLFYIWSKWSSIHIVLFSQPSLPWLLPMIFLRRVIRGTYPLFVMDTRTVPMEDFRKASLKDRVRGWFYDLANRVGNHLVDGQTTITARMAQKIQVPADQLWGVWPSGADLDQFEEKQASRIWPSSDKPIQLIYIGVLHYERNLMALCKAVMMANQQGMNFRLILTGSGTERDDLEAYAQNTKGIIKVNDPIPHDAVPAHLALAHVGVLPFPDEEKYRVSSPIKLFEYMASGMAILATRIVCHTDVIKDRNFGFWSEGSSTEDLLSALRNIWASRALLPSMGSEAAEASKEWTWKEFAKKLNKALIHGLIRDSRISHPMHHSHKPARD